MQAILSDGHTSAGPLSQMLITFFTPQCLPPQELFAAYAQLSSAVRNPDTRYAALALLRRLDISYAGSHLPPNQFSALLPVLPSFYHNCGKNSVIQVRALKTGLAASDCPRMKCQGAGGGQVPRIACPDSGLPTRVGRMRRKAPEGVGIAG